MKRRLKNESSVYLWLDVLILLAVIGVVIFSISSVQAAPAVIDFDNNADGKPISKEEIIDDEYAGFGFISQLTTIVWGRTGIWQWHLIPAIRQAGTLT